ncbi:tripartite tricarboxylate transporter substrate binding protein [Acidovorax sp. ACV02]|uniref:Bug family tripartite tricarboxylate transporter substrate binding protein n=1 Tax=Acidovorax sp. ACV02 TaxID=2769310 RepID=UPI00177A851F|nr:tripartite tricarboxylate transporter substrate binding protein [Acidovorax sp. ACV02]MBD9408381.1 tripartite tricarboxylate transporter substrate binding protein [Acidovorax sp. ACV02]
MKSQFRRSLAYVLLATLASPLINATAAADTNYPTGPVRFIVPFAAGGGPDTVARLVGQRLSEIWKQPVVIDNKVGGSSIIATGEVVRAKPDGQTVLVNIALLVQNPSLRSKLPFDTFKELTPVVPMAYDSLFLVASTSTKARDVKSFTEVVRAEPGKFAFGTFGNGSTAHLLMIALEKGADLSLIHVPYQGTAPVAQALMSSEVQFGLLPYATARQVLESGKAVALGVTGSKRAESLPQVPTLVESGLKGFEGSNWIGLFLPSATPKYIVEKLNRDVNEALRSPSIQARLKDIGSLPGGGSVTEFSSAVKNDYEHYRALIRAGNVKVE